MSQYGKIKRVLILTQGGVLEIFQDNVSSNIAGNFQVK